MQVRSYGLFLGCFDMTAAAVLCYNFSCRRGSCFENKQLDIKDPIAIATVVLGLLAPPKAMVQLVQLKDELNQFQHKYQNNCNYLAFDRYYNNYPLAKPSKDCGKVDQT